MANSDGNQNWLALYREAVLESDRRKIKTRVAEAQTAIQAPRQWSCGTRDRCQKRPSAARWTRLSHFLGLLGHDRSRQMSAPQAYLRGLSTTVWR